jgi:chemosensory pili system protein ChpC
VNDETIRAIVAPLAVDRLLLPSNVVAEVISFDKPSPLIDSPPWLLGDLEWRGWQVPIISFAILSQAATRDPVSSDSRILVLKTLTEHPSLNYVGIVIKGLPKLTKLTADSLAEAPEERLSPVVFSRVSLDEQAAMVPDLRVLTEEVAAALDER